MTDLARVPPAGTPIPPRISKKRRKELTRALLDSQPLGQPFSRDALSAFNRLTGFNAAHVVRLPNPKFPRDTRHVAVNGRTESWGRAIDGYDDTQKLKRVMRRIISLDLRDFLSALEPCECEQCGATADLTVDHVDPPFDTIATDFIRNHGPIAIEKRPDGVGYGFADLDMEAQWIADHAAHAVYQVLCRSCNASKGKRGAA